MVDYKPKVKSESKFASAVNKKERQSEHLCDNNIRAWRRCRIARQFLRKKTCQLNPTQISCAFLHNELRTRARLLKSRTKSATARVPLFDPRRPRNPLHGQCNRLPPPSQRRSAVLPVVILKPAIFFHSATITSIESLGGREAAHTALVHKQVFVLGRWRSDHSELKDGLVTTAAGHHTVIPEERYVIHMSGVTGVDSPWCMPHNTGSIHQIDVA